MKILDMPKITLEDPREVVRKQREQITALLLENKELLASVKTLERALAYAADISPEIVLDGHILSGDWDDTPELTALTTNEYLRVRLAVGEADWSERAMDEVRLCLPPIRRFPTNRGARFGRWLVCSIFPYPTFLLGAEWVATRFRLPLTEFTRIARGPSGFAEGLRATMYTGFLSSTRPERWWRAGVEQFLWDYTDGRPWDFSLLHGLIRKSCEHKFETLHKDAEIVCVDEELHVLPVPVRSDDAVRILPENWPGYAESAWTPIERLSGSPYLQEIVDPIDRYRICDDSREETT